MIRFEEAPQTTMQGNYFSQGTEKEFNGIATESCTLEYVYEQFRNFVWNGRLYDFHGLPLAERDGISVDGDDPSGKFWRCRVKYEAPQISKAVESAARAASGVDYGAFPASFSTSGGSGKLMTSLSTTRYNIEGVAPNLGGMIGWNGESFDGVDVVTPKLTFTIQKRTPYDALQNFAGFAVPLADLVGKTNASKFYGFSPGVVLFLGVSSGGLQRTQDGNGNELFYWDVKCEFAASPNTTFKLGGTTIKKPGWDAYWQLTAKSYDPSTGTIYPIVVGAYVERCYERADFSWFTN